MKIILKNKESYEDIIWQYTTPKFLPSEIWKNIPKELIVCEETYQVSTKIRRRDLLHMKTKNNDGYMIININGKYFKVHRLVVYIYIHNDDLNNKIVVNHIDEKKEIIIQWCTQNQNVQHSQTYKK